MEGVGSVGGSHGRESWSAVILRTVALSQSLRDIPRQAVMLHSIETDELIFNTALVKSIAQH